MPGKNVDMWIFSLNAPKICHNFMIYRVKDSTQLNCLTYCFYCPKIPDYVRKYGYLYGYYA